MPKRSKIEVRGHADQVRLLVEAGNTEQKIAALLDSKDPEGKWTQQDVNRFKLSVLKRVRTPAERVAKRWDKDASDALAVLQSLVDFVGGLKNDAELGRDVRETISTKLEVLREKLRILGQYPREGAQVGVQVNVAAQRETLWDWMQARTKEALPMSADEAERASAERVKASEDQK